MIPRRRETPQSRGRPGRHWTGIWTDEKTRQDTTAGEGVDLKWTVNMGGGPGGDETSIGLPVLGKPLQDLIEVGSYKIAPLDGPDSFKDLNTTDSRTNKTLGTRIKGPSRLSSVTTRNGRYEWL